MKPRFDVLVAGELNVDIVLEGLTEDPGQDARARAVSVTPRSASATFAGNLQCLGPRVAFLGKVGRDALGGLVVESLRSRGVDTGFVQEEAGASTGATFLLGPRVVSCPGAMELLTLEDCTPQRLLSARHFHFTSAFLPPGLGPHLPDFFRAAKECGLTTSFDPQWSPGRDGALDLPSILPFVDVVLMDEAELLHHTGLAEAAGALDMLVSHARILVVKMGERGSMGRYGGVSLHMPPCLNPRVADTAGAGESFDAGFLCRFIQGASLEACLAFGNLMGAVATTAPGGAGAFGSLEAVRAAARERFGQEV